MDILMMDIKELRKAAGLTQRQLADASGLNIRQVQKIEAGEIEPGNMTAKNVFALADALGVDARRLI